MRASRYAASIVGAIALVAPMLPTASYAASGACDTAFTEAFRVQLGRDFPGRVTAAVHDTRTGCWHHINPGMRISTASVIKAQILGALLVQAEDQRRSLSATERSLAESMIRYSSDAAAAAIYGRVGGVAGMAAFDRRIGISNTSHDTRYGGTMTTAEDRTQVSLALLYGGGPISQSLTHEAWRYLGNVHPTQQWGVTAGIRLGWSAALKNGFYPGIGDRWRVGSTGFLRVDGGRHGYAITVLTTGMPDQATGIRLVETIAAEAAARLSAGRLQRRSVDRARCTTTRRGESWAAVAARLGVPRRVADVQRVSGGNPTPLSRGRACAPDLRRTGWGR